VRGVAVAWLVPAGPEAALPEEQGASRRQLQQPTAGARQTRSVRGCQQHSCNRKGEAAAVVISPPHRHALCHDPNVGRNKQTTNTPTPVHLNRFAVRQSTHNPPPPPVCAPLTRMSAFTVTPSHCSPPPRAQNLSIGSVAQTDCFTDSLIQVPWQQHPTPAGITQVLSNGLVVLRTRHQPPKPPRRTH
jgi:hypothetical protein